MHFPEADTDICLSDIFFSEIAWPIKAKFSVEPPADAGT